MLRIVIALAVSLGACNVCAALAAAEPSPAAGPTQLPSGVATPATPPASDATPPMHADPAVTARAKEWLHRAQTGNIDHKQLDDQMNALMTDAVVKQVAAQLGPLGDPLKFEYVETRSLTPNTLYVYKVTFKGDSSYWLFSTNDAGKIAGMRLTPPPQ